MAVFSGRLTKAPLIYALCEARFAPILKMSSFVPDIQERLRSVYEGFDEEQVTDVQVPPSGQFAARTATRWRFERADQRAGYILQNATLVYHTTAYTDFDQFVTQIVHGLSTVATIANVPRYLRIGLRYVDLIEPIGRLQAEDCLHEQLRGFGKELPNVKEQVMQQIYGGDTAMGGRLLLRVTKGSINFPLPADLLPVSLVPARVPDPRCMSIFLDTDHFIDRAEAIPSTDKIEKFIRELKEPIRDGFKKAVTQEAVDLWK